MNPADAPVTPFLSGETETAFLDVASFQTRNGHPTPSPGPASAWSPFLSVYEVDGVPNHIEAPAREAYTVLLHELYDEEFDGSLYELLTAARGLHEGHLAAGRSLADADRLVAQHFSELVRESESMVDAMARELGSRDAASLDREMDAFAERYVPAAPLEPEFQHFLGGFVKKLGRGLSAIAKTAVKGITALGLGPILNKIKAIVRPLLNKVLQMAIGRLPAAVQPAARMLAQRLGLAPAPAVATAPAAGPALAPAQPSVSGTAGDAGQDPAPLTDAGSPVQPSAGSDVSEMQLEFDRLVAEALLAPDDPEFELELARTSASAGAAAPPVFTDLDLAREQFVSDLQNLKEGESPAPYVENFLPAVLPVLRIATRLIGRPRVVNFLAGFLGKLISNLVGPAQTPALSRAMVDAGLKLISLEAGDPDQESRVATSAVAATVEETVARVASLPDHVLDNQELLEGFTLDAFEQAAAANLPALFSDATYRKRPELLEGGVNAAWVMLPLRRPRYKRCSRTFTVKITPQMADAIQTFEDTPLSEYLQDRVGVFEGEDVEAELHLFEVAPGGTAADIARNETATPGLGAADEVTLSQLHPLTREAAGVLLGKPALGRPVPPGSDIRTVSPGQRLFHMAIGRHPLTVVGPLGRRILRRLARVDATLDIVGDQIRVAVFFSEGTAQKIAVRLRQQSHVGSLAVAFHRLLGRRLPPILHGRRPRRLRIVQPGVAPGPGSAPALGRLPAAVPPVFVAKVHEWLVEAFSAFAKADAQKFLAAAEAPADGVTLVFTIEHPPGLKQIGQALTAQGAAAAGDLVGAIANGAKPTVRVDAVAGYPA